MAEPEVYYHVTSYKNWPAIRDGGLTPGADGHVWLFTEVSSAMLFKDAWGRRDWDKVPPTEWRAPPCIVVVRTDRAAPTRLGIPGSYWVEGPVTKDEVYDVIRPGDLHHYAKTAADQDYSDSVMICLRPSEALRKVYADMDECTEDADELHLTLYYLGTTEEAGGLAGQERLYRGLYDFALHSGYRGLTGQINGFGCFMNGEENVLVALWDIPGIAEFRTWIMKYCRDHGFSPRQDNHGFTPHQTLAYSKEPVLSLPSLPEGNPDKEIFGSIWLVWGEEWTEIQLP